MFAILKTDGFRQAYHQALDHTAHIPQAQLAAARTVIEQYFLLQEVTDEMPFCSDGVYFTEHAIEVGGHFKFLVPGTIDRGLVQGPLFLLVPKPAELPQSVDPKEFDSAASAVEAVRLTLMPERVNGIISFVLDAKKFYAQHDVFNAERAIGTAFDHFNRAASDGLRHIASEAERGKRSNEVAGTRRTLADLRKKLQAEHHSD